MWVSYVGLQTTRFIYIGIYVQHSFFKLEFIRRNTHHYLDLAVESENASSKQYGDSIYLKVIEKYVHVVFV